jgi:hypothetical protein
MSASGVRSGGGYAAAGVVLVGGAAMKAQLGLPCPLTALTGWLCPACGATRAVLALADGDLRLAVRDNLVLVAVAAAGMLVLATPALRGRTARLPRDRAWPTYAAAALLVVFAVLRNLSGLEFLRPPA